MKRVALDYRSKESKGQRQSERAEFDAKTDNQTDREAD